MTVPKLKIGLLVNPLAGIGGPVGLKGSDNVAAEAIRLGGVSQVAARTSVCLRALDHQRIEWLAVPGPMGASLLQDLGLPHQVIGEPTGTEITTATDTRRGVDALCSAGIDLLLFSGGDGTARDVADSVHSVPAVLGIPCGVKMHSGVFATTPGAAASLVNQLLAGEILSVINREVRDIDEASFRDGVVKTRFYGELPVPDDLRYVQQTKVGGREVEGLVLQDIAAHFSENMDPHVLYLMGSGSTVAAIMSSLGLASTLLGIDAIRGGELVGTDLTELQILDLLAEGGPAKIVVTAISGQGHIFGRGNQQLSARVIRQVGITNIQIIASKSKLAGLDHRPLLVDTGDAALDKALAGMKSILTGYDDQVLYQVA